MEDKPNNPPAFPRPYSDDETDEKRASDIWKAQSGMTLRDYFAGEQLIAFGAHLANDSMEQAQYIAEYCYNMADAMLKQRNKDCRDEQKKKMAINR